MVADYLRHILTGEATQGGFGTPAARTRRSPLGKSFCGSLGHVMEKSAPELHNAVGMDARLRRLRPRHLHEVADYYRSSTSAKLRSAVLHGEVANERRRLAATAPQFQGG
jgi:hypothetical protein